MGRGPVVCEFGRWRRAVGIALQRRRDAHVQRAGQRKHQLVRQRPPDQRMTEPVFVPRRLDSHQKSGTDRAPDRERHRFNRPFDDRGQKAQVEGAAQICGAHQQFAILFVDRR